MAKKATKSFTTTTTSGQSLKIAFSCASPRQVIFIARRTADGRVGWPAPPPPRTPSFIHEAKKVSPGETTHRGTASVRHMNDNKMRPFTM